MDKVKKYGLNFIKMIVVPLTVYLFFLVLCKVMGVDGFGVGSDLIVMLRTTVYSGLIALAVSYNLTSGRFDFSIGATLVLSTILGGSLALSYNLGPVPMLLLCCLFGAILGTIGGFVYVTLRIPPMIVSLGIAMIYEAIGFVISQGAGVKMIGHTDMLIWATQPYIYILCAVVVIILAIILNYTQFGYNTNALRSGQEIAVNVGINEKKNTIICYTIAGVLLAAAGVINMSILGTMAPNMGLASMAYIQSAFLPMFIGTMLSKYGDRNFGVVMGALTQAIITSAFGRMGVPSSWQAIFNGIIVITFFAYSFNSHKLVEARMFKEKRLKAEQELA